MNDGVIRGEDARKIQDEIRHGTPDTPERVQRIREAEAIYARLHPSEATFREALKVLVAKLDECQPHVAGAFTFCWAHGMRYDGPNYAEELKAAKALLASGSPQK